MGIKAVPVLYWYEMRWGGGKRLGPFCLWYSSTHFIYYFSFQEFKKSKALRWGYLFRVAPVMPKTGKDVLVLPR